MQDEYEDGIIARILEYLGKLKEERRVLEDNPKSGRHSIYKTEENVKRASQKVRRDRP